MTIIDHLENNLQTAKFRLSPSTVEGRTEWNFCHEKHQSKSMYREIFLCGIQHADGQKVNWQSTEKMYCTRCRLNVKCMSGERGEGQNIQADDEKARITWLRRAWWTDRLANWLRFRRNRWLGGQGRSQFDSHPSANPKLTRLCGFVGHRCAF